MKRRLPRASTGIRRVLAAAIILTSCGNTHVLSSEGRSTEEQMPTMQESREETIRATHGLVSALTSVGLQTRFADGNYSRCAGRSIPGHLGLSDDGGIWRYRTKGRLDLPDGQAGSAAHAAKMRDALTSAGWEPETGFLGSVDGIQELGDRWTVHVQRERLTASVESSAAAPIVLFRVLGPCLPATREEEQEYLDAMATKGAEKLDLDEGDER